MFVGVAQGLVLVLALVLVLGYTLASLITTHPRQTVYLTFSFLFFLFLFIVFSSRDILSLRWITLRRKACHEVGRTPLKSPTE